MLRTTRRLMTVAVAIGLAGLALASTAFGRDYDVTITDLTSGQPLTPPVIATHHGKHAIFEVGQPASVGVREIAENGNSAPLLAQLEANPFGDIFDFTESTSGPLVPPGVPGDAMFDQSVTLDVQASPKATRLSWVSMLICTNDGFTGVDSIKLPSAVGRSTSADTNGYFMPEEGLEPTTFGL
jgi:Spondin_N